MKFNFYAGPAILPKSVFEEASRAVIDFNGSGLSILEISHRSNEASEMMDEAHSLVKELMSLPDTHQPIFLQGGASSQFGMIPMNFLGEGESAGYINTGNWSEKAIKDARLYGDVKVLGDSSDKEFSYIPKGHDVPSNIKYLHLTSNNTVRGTQYHDFPNVDVPLVADMSSDIFSRNIQIQKFGLIYAGAQKNMGPAGTTLVIINKEFASKKVRKVAAMQDYQNHMAKESSYNTPPLFSVYVSMLNLRWLKNQGGITQIALKNKEKSNLLYTEIDGNDLFYGTTAAEDRSTMSVTFKLHDDSLEADFLQQCANAGCIGVKGHRSVGGFRASIYNAMDIEGVKCLVDVMQQFGKKKG